MAPKFGVLAWSRPRLGKEQDVWDFLSGGREIVLERTRNADLVRLPGQREHLRHLRHFRYRRGPPGPPQRGHPRRPRPARSRPARQGSGHQTDRTHRGEIGRGAVLLPGGGTLTRTRRQSGPRITAPAVKVPPDRSRLPDGPPTCDAALPCVNWCFRTVVPHMTPPYRRCMAIQDIYPTALRLLGRPVLVVGGGPVAARRAKGLLDAGARVTVVAPRCLPGAARTRRRRPPHLGAAPLPSAPTSTASGSSRPPPAIPPWTRRLRPTPRRSASGASTPPTTKPPPPGRPPSPSWTTSRSPSTPGETRAAPWPCATPSPPPWKPATCRCAAAAPHRGSVALVGGGPGDTGLITVRGRRLLGQADVVVADRLGPRELLNELAPDVRVIEVGKTPGHHPVPQSEINRILVDEALQGHRVVRLKGGDPYVLGRGGEEAEFCRQHGVEVEVVSGVTSAISVPAAAGIPVTHRGLAKGFSVVTGHEELSEVPARADHTVILLMGVGQLRDSAASLGRAGLPAETPVGIVENGYLPNQRVTIGTLGTIADQAEAAGVANPAVIVIGDVVRVSPFAPSHFKTADYSTTTPNAPARPAPPDPRTDPLDPVNCSITAVMRPQTSVYCEQLMQKKRNTAVSTSTPVGTAARPLRVAVVGSGPGRRLRRGHPDQERGRQERRADGQHRPLRPLPGALRPDPLRRGPGPPAHQGHRQRPAQGPGPRRHPLLRQRRLRHGPRPSRTSAPTTTPSSSPPAPSRTRT